MSIKTIVPAHESSLVHFDDIKDQIIKLISSQLSPLRDRYAYSDYDLQGFVQWKPIVLILGNYSAGKSTFINELLGQNLQRTGQAPTDDSFTVITYLDSSHPESVVERDGRVLLGDETLPFKRLKSQGERFLSHFRSKQVQSDILRNIAIIDTPGMLDSIAEKDRGYDYQEVIGELASLADLVLLLFDAHKAGTVRESHLSLRNTIPKATMEDRVIFVLNRVDECQNIDDLLRVYGSLCWNLSQMTGRKDIPRIFMSYAATVERAHIGDPILSSYLSQIAHQKQEIIEQIIDIPRKRMDHLATYVETHTHRISMYIAAMLAYKISLQKFYLLAAAYTGVVLFAFIGVVFVWLGIFYPNRLYLFSREMIALSLKGLLVGAIVVQVWAFFFKKWRKRHGERFMDQIYHHLKIDNQYDKEHAAAILHLIKDRIFAKKGAHSGKERSLSKRQMRQDRQHLIAVEDKIVTIRKEIGEIRLSKVMSSPFSMLSKKPTITEPAVRSSVTTVISQDMSTQQQETSSFKQDVQEAKNYSHANAIRPIVHRQVGLLQDMDIPAFSSDLQTSMPVDASESTEHVPHPQQQENGLDATATEDRMFNQKSTEVCSSKDSE